MLSAQLDYEIKKLVGVIEGKGKPLMGLIGSATDLQRQLDAVVRQLGLPANGLDDGLPLG